MTPEQERSLHDRYRCSCCGGVRFPLRKKTAVCFRCDQVVDWPAVKLIGPAGGR